MPLRRYPLLKTLPSLAISVFVSQAMASPTSDALKSIGLIGSSWRQDCARPASLNNSGIMFVVQRGKSVIESIPAGVERGILEAKILSSSDISLTIANTSSSPPFNIITVYRKTSSTIQPWSSTSSVEGPVIRDGKVTGMGQPTPIMHRCQPGQ